MKTIKGISNTEHTAPEKLNRHIGETVRIHGSIYKIRKMIGFAFVLIRTARSIIQCIYSKQYAEFPLELLTEEICVTATAHVIEEPRSKTGSDLHLLQIRILSTPEAVTPVVINNKRVETSLDNLLNYRPVTLRNERERAVFKLQEGICCGFRNFLLQEQFTEIHTPKIVYAGAEGGSNIFRLNYFDKEAYLTQSPQFYKQMMVGVFERVFEIAPVFRAEKHDTSRHLNEYTSVDFEMGYIEHFEELMEVEVRMLKYTINYLQQYYHSELQLLGVTLPVITEIPSIRFADAKQLIAEQYHLTNKNVDDFEPEEEKLLCEYVQNTIGSEFVFVTHYPSNKRPFYAMECPENPNETLSFDLLFRGLEITTGGQRIHNYRMQIEKMKKRQMNIELFESYLMMHKYAMPPHGGLGLGLERFTAQLTGHTNVRSATLFPRDLNRLIP